MPVEYTLGHLAEAHRVGRRMHDSETDSIPRASSSRPRRKRRAARARFAIWGSAAALLISLFLVNLPAAPPTNPQVVVIPIEGMS